MKPTSILLSITLFIGTAVSAFAEEFKVATVDMHTLLTQFHETKSAEAEAKVENEGIKKKDQERMEAIIALRDDLKKLAAEFQDPSLAEAKRKAVQQKAMDAEQNLKMLGREREEFLQRRSRALKEKMGEKMSSLRNTVIKTVREYAATQDVDYVFDGSGLTATQVPFLLYVKEPVDITEGVLKELNKNAPAQPEKKAEEPAKK